MKWSILSKHRKFIMAMAAVWILLGHAVQDKGLLFLTHFGGLFTQYGAMGVDVFLFMSGVGWYYSYRKNGLSCKLFYKKRYKSLLIKYLPAAVFYYAVKAAAGYSPAESMMDVLTLSFWFYHRGVWYVAMLFPLYLIFPLWRKWAEQDANLRTIRILLSIVISSVLTQLMPHEIEELSNIAYAYNRIPTVLIGYYFGKSIADGKKIQGAEVLILPAVYLFIRILGISSLVYSWMTFGGLCAIVFAIVAELLQRYLPQLYRWVTPLGGITLEIYLFNIYLRDAGFYFGVYNAMKNKNLYCLIIVILTVAVSFAYERCISGIGQKLLCKKGL